MRHLFPAAAIRLGILGAVWLATLLLDLDHQAQATWLIIALILVVGWWAV
jgi:hypothetical protein